MRVMRACALTCQLCVCNQHIRLEFSACSRSWFLQTFAFLQQRKKQQLHIHDFLISFAARRCANNSMSPPFSSRSKNLTPLMWSAQKCRITVNKLFSYSENTFTKSHFKRIYLYDYLVFGRLLVTDLSPSRTCLLLVTLWTAVNFSQWKHTYIKVIKLVKGSCTKYDRLRTFSCAFVQWLVKGLKTRIFTKASSGINSSWEITLAMAEKEEFGSKSLSKFTKEYSYKVFVFPVCLQKHSEIDRYDNIAQVPKHDLWNLQLRAVPVVVLHFVRFKKRSVKEWKVKSNNCYILIT